MGERTTPYKYGNRIGPSMAQIVAKYPQHCRVYYRGHSYKFIQCAWGECPNAHGFWRRYSTVGNRGSGTTNPKHIYCSDSCARKSRHLLRKARQLRWARKNKEHLAAWRKQWYLKNKARLNKARRR